MMAFTDWLLYRAVSLRYQQHSTSCHDENFIVSGADYNFKSTPNPEYTAYLRSLDGTGYDECIHAK